MKLRLQLLIDTLRYSYVTVPMSLALCGLLLAMGTLQLDALSFNVASEKAPQVAATPAPTAAPTAAPAPTDETEITAPAPTTAPTVSPTPPPEAASTSTSAAKEPLSRGMRALQFGQSLLYAGGVDGARALLGAIAGSIISVAALASSIAITALALASGQFGSRLLRNFMDDRGFQITLGTFNGTFLFCLVILRSTRSAEEGGGGVPQISVTMSLVLAVACVFLLIYFLHHMARAIQAPYVIADAAHDLNQEIERLYGKSVEKKAAAAPDRIKEIEDGELPDWREGFDIESDKEGYIKAVNYDLLLRVAIQHDCTFKLAFRAGEWVGQGDALLTVWPPRSPVAYEEKARDSFIMGRDRSAVQDPEYGVNQLVEVAARALSPGINDPFTAMTCLDYLGGALTHVLRCDIPAPYLLDENRKLRLIVNSVTFPGLCDAAFNMIRQFGADSPAVMIRMLETLARVGAKCNTQTQSDAIAHHARLARDEALKQISVDRDVTDIENRYARVLRAIADHKNHEA